jgi:hypothetical protein
MMIGSMGTITHTTGARRPQSPLLVDMIKVNQGQDDGFISLYNFENF